MLYPDFYPAALPSWVYGTNLEEKGVTMEQIEAFNATLVQHIAYVQEAGKRLNVPEHQLRIHDISKFSPGEYLAYARNFHGTPDPDAFALAWSHHIHRNPHHWQYWIFPDGFTPKGSSVENGVIEMAQPYALEMVADWMGASRAYTGSDDMASWLWDNMPKMTVHSKTAYFLRGLLDALGYADVVFVQRFKSEIAHAQDAVQ